MDVPDVLTLLFRLAVGVGVLFAAYLLLFGRRADFVIEVRGGQVRHKGKIALAVVQQLTPFLLHDLGITDSVRILGSLNGGRMRVWFRGHISPGQQQRIRNFLANG
jgi:hypothetical protein